MMLAVGGTTTGYYFYKVYEDQYRAEVERQLSAVADLKITEILQWRNERLADGAVFLHNDSFSDRVTRLKENPRDDTSRNHLSIWLRQVLEAYRYDRLTVLDTDGEEIAAYPPTPEPVPPHLVTVVADTLRSKQVSMLDFHRDSPDTPIHLAVLVPIYSDEDQNLPLAVLVLRINPKTALYPIIQRWPTASRTAETLIVRREADRVVFLNELRFDKHAALKRSEPLSNIRLPAVMAVKGETGIVEGVDYRGIEVMAAVRHVVDTPWFLVARMDSEEIFAPLKTRLWFMVVIVAALLFTAAAVLMLVWRQQSLYYVKESLKAARKLTIQEAELRRRNEELTRFAYSVSHDLKSPLVTIQTFSGYLEKDLLDDNREQVRKDLDFIRIAATKMGKLLEELLELSRVGRIVNPPEEIPLQTLVQEVLAMSAGRIRTSGVSIEVTDQPVLLYGDRVRLIEVFQNLVDNAVKFMNGQVAPRIEIGIEDLDGEHVLFVRDNGRGIDPRHAPKIFGLFEKLDSTVEGTGVGLALVAKIIETHGGRIWVSSEGPGHGACFRFTIKGLRIASRKDTGQ